MKIVLTRPNYNSHIITPPLGIGYLASYLKKNGIEAIIIDGLKEALSAQELAEKIEKEKPDIVGITCLTAFYNETVELSKILKEKGFKVVIGGVHPTFLPYKTLKESNADFVVCGEGEIPLLKLLKNGFSNEGIAGVYSLNELASDEDLFTKSEIVTNLDDLPFPDWEQIDPNTYPKAPHGAFTKNYPVGIIMTSRGCPFECTFCASRKFYDRRIRFRSPENVISEIEYLVNKFGVREIHFEDDNLTMLRDRAERIFNEIIIKKLDISWSCPNGIRADRVDRELIYLMKKSGCYRFAYGIESANKEILRKIKKKETIEAINEAIDIADSEGILCQGFFIFGLPGETKKTIEETINFAVNSKLSLAQFLILDVLPGSELWDMLKGSFIPNWGKNSYKEPEWIPDFLTKEYLLKAQSRAFRKFYLRPRIIFKLIKIIGFGHIKYLFHRTLDYRIISAN